MIDRKGWGGVSGPPFDKKYKKVAVLRYGPFPFCGSPADEGVLLVEYPASDKAGCDPQIFADGVAAPLHPESRARNSSHAYLKCRMLGYVMCALADFLGSRLVGPTVFHTHQCCCNRVRRRGQPLVKNSNICE